MMAVPYEHRSPTVPAELAALPQFVAWRPIERDGKTIKVPISPITGGRASTTNPGTWGTLDQAQDHARTVVDDGIGFVFSADDSFTGVDLDKCRDPATGANQPWATKIIRDLNSYTEISPSGTGVHIFVKATKPGGRCKVMKPGIIEMYDHDRYFTITCDHLPGTPTTIEARQHELETLYASVFAADEPQPQPGPTPSGGPNMDDAELIDRAKNAKNGAAFSALWNGDTSAHENNHSLADLALCGALMFWTGNDKARTDRLFRQSGLMRSKWERADYREMTLEKAMQQETYTGPGQQGHKRPRPIRPDQEQEGGDTLPAIDAGERDLPTITGSAWDALTAKNDPPRLVLHSGTPVRIETSAEGEITLVTLTEARMRHEVARAAHWYMVRGKTPQRVGVEPPLSVIQDMLADPNPPLPVLRRITATPIFAPDGRLIETAGYDAASRIFLHPAPGLTIPRVPEKPTAQDIARARDLICSDLLGDFPFASDGDRAAAVALHLLPFAREMIDGLTPMHGIESPQAGNGKGLLADACTRPAFGHLGGSLTEASTNDEWRKQIGGKLRSGAPIIRYDNIFKPLDSAALASALTASVFEDRLLGQNETFKASARCVWLFTANNPVMSTEIARRTVRIRIDAKKERPWERTGFRHPNLYRWMDERRGDLIHAALTIIRAWIAADKPIADVTLGSYEQWAGIMGGILEVTGVPGFLTNLADFYEAADIEGEAWGAFIAQWWVKWGTTKLGVGDLFPIANLQDGLDFGNGGERA
jgi:hypothetical protein